MSGEGRGSGEGYGGECPAHLAIVQRVQDVGSLQERMKVLGVGVFKVLDGDVELLS